MGRKRVGVRSAFAICFALVLLGGASAGFGQRGPDTSIVKARAKHLQCGINLCGWFAQVYDAKGYTKEHFESWNGRHCTDQGAGI